MYVTSLFVFPSTLLSPKMLVLFPMDNYSFEISSLFPRTGLCGNRQQQVQQPQHFISIIQELPLQITDKRKFNRAFEFHFRAKRKKSGQVENRDFGFRKFVGCRYSLTVSSLFFCVFSCTFYYLICDCNKVGSTNSYEPKCLLFLSVIYSILEIFVRPLVLFPEFFFRQFLPVSHLLSVFFCHCHSQHSLTRVMPRSKIENFQLNPKV